MKKPGILFIAFVIGLSFSLQSFAQEEEKKNEKPDVKNEVKQESVEQTDGKPFNTICAVSGEPVDPEITYTYEGKTYAVCCNNCLKKFKKDPAKYSSRISEDGKSLKKNKKG
jgi:YHS domain-containing protein